MSGICGTWALLLSELSSPQALIPMTALPLCCQLKQGVVFLEAAIYESCEVIQLCQSGSLVTTPVLRGFEMIKWPHTIPRMASPNQIGGVL